MTLLPIVARELRTASRRSKTYWLRLAAALTALFICVWIGLFTARALPASMLGRTLFSYLSILAFGYCLLVGPFVTADCVSEEKREGTLGLLFLTDLRSYDVVLGKWVAASLSGLYGLLAIMPALGLPLLFGGVTPDEYVRTALAVLNAIFFALALGMFASTVSREQGKATLASAILILGLSGLLPGLATAASTHFFTRALPSSPLVVLASPAYTGYLATEAVYKLAPRNYWVSLGLVHGLAWLGLILTAVIIPRVWREDPAEKPIRYRWLWRLGYTAGWRKAFRRRLERNPVFAAEARLRWPHAVFWSLVALVTLNVYWLTLGYRGTTSGAEFHTYFSTALVFTNRVWITVMACWFFLESRRTGALELLLTSPLPVRTILRGHWRAVWNLFFWPVVAISLLHVFYVVGSARFQGGNPALGLLQMKYLMANAGVSLTNFLTDVLAICFVGAWLSLSIRRPTLAIFLTFAVVILVPWTIGTFVPSFSTLLTMLPQTWMNQLIQKPFFRDWVLNNSFVYALGRSGIWVAKNLVLILWARGRLKRCFREAAAQTLGRSRRRPGGGWLQTGAGVGAVAPAKAAGDA